jgi:hypothetical protein
MIKKYTKKPVMIEAVIYDGQNLAEIKDFCGENNLIAEEGYSVAIVTLEGNMVIRPGDYVIKGVEGEFYRCKPEIFAQTYDEAAA